MHFISIIHIISRFKIVKKVLFGMFFSIPAMKLSIWIASMNEPMATTITCLNKVSLREMDLDSKIYNLLLDSNSGNVASKDHTQVGLFSTSDLELRTSFPVVILNKIKNLVRHTNWMTYSFFRNNFSYCRLRDVQFQLSLPSFLVNVGEVLTPTVFFIRLV